MACSQTLLTSALVARTMTQSAFDFDQAVALQSLGVGQYVGNTHAAWLNMVGPFGGMTAAVMLQAVMQQQIFVEGIVFCCNKMTV